MNILSGFKKVRRRIRLPDGYKLLSFWTSSQSVEMDDGTTLESNKTKWDDASSKKHEHSNKTALDQITSDKLSQWDSLAASSVTGVKGNAETSYRKGNVNITPANIGLGNVNNTSDINKPISTATQNAVNQKVSKTGDTITGTLASSKITSTFLAGNQGQTIINSTAGAGTYTMLDKLNSSNGYFTDGVYQNARMFYYTSKSLVNSGTNNFTKSLTLLDENGNSKFPGTVAAASFSGNATSATKAIQDGSGNTITTKYWNKDRDIIITRSSILNQMTLQGNYDGYTEGTIEVINNYKAITVIPKQANTRDVCWVDCILYENNKIGAILKNTVVGTKTFSPIVTVIYLRTS